jgi:hypothetical protein
MKQIIFKITVMAVALFFVSCDWFRFPSAAISNYFIYITGETGRSVDISYLQRDKGDSRKNTTVNETVTLPFSKEVCDSTIYERESPGLFFTNQF